ncbi:MULTISPECIES: N-acetyltransferase [unclassified Duganella]|uniref:N-acetyltransferase n=1 Tax=unclassified Duganella TaxID=2636909 RepID=UPI000E347EB8|nr:MULTISPECIES: N-acetyltransferase [unclassified Duganella]RFP11457.1 N-acetyltransferase [Duganella sp. BJB475]RFP29777.1 N-acetyltransferase [Duganella sp. BJB476]
MHKPALDLELLERWLAGWSLARGLPLPRRDGGGLVVEVGWPEQLRRHVFLDAGPALQACAARVDQAGIYLKAAVDTEAMRRALPASWTIEQARYLMHRAAPMAGQAAAPAGYALQTSTEHGAHVVRYVDANGQTAALGRVVLNEGTAIFDRIETMEGYRRLGLASAVMFALDALAGDAERLLVATEAGRALYASLGWQVLAPYSTAVLAGG